MVEVPQTQVAVRCMFSLLLTHPCLIRETLCLEGEESYDRRQMSQELDMFATIKEIVAIGIACGTMIASIVETSYPRFAFCFWVAFGFGVYVAEWTRTRRLRRVRYLSSRLIASASSST